MSKENLGLTGGALWLNMHSNRLVTAVARLVTLAHLLSWCAWLVAPWDGVESALEKFY
jgi:hypothetical protein